MQDDKKLPSNKYQTAHYDPESDTMILRLVDETDIYTKTTQQQYFNDILNVQRAFVASLRVVQELPDMIDPDKPPRNYKDAMSRLDNQEWVEAYQKELLCTCQSLRRSVGLVLRAGSGVNTAAITDADNRHRIKHTMAILQT